MNNEAPAQLTPRRLLAFSFGFAPPAIIEAGIRLGVFDLLDGSTRTAAEVAAAIGAQTRAARLVLNALVGLELLTKDPQERYALTAESAEYLVSGKPTFHGAFFLLVAKPMFSEWSRLCEIVRDGRPAYRIDEEQDGTGFFQQFVEHIFPIHLAGARRLAEIIGMARLTAPCSVLDLAAGSGVWSIAMAQASPHVAVTAVDWPGIIPITKKVTAREGVAPRYRYVAGDLHAADFGNAHKLATLGHILHSEGEARSRRLLAKTFDALAPGGTIAIAEILVDEDRKGPLPALLFAVNMLVNSESGDTFSFAEITDWLRAAQFDEIRTVEVPGLAPRIVLATKPKR